MEFLKCELNGKLATPNGVVWVNLNDVKLVLDRNDLCSEDNVLSRFEIKELILDIGNTRESICVFANGKYLSEMLSKVKADFICLTKLEDSRGKFILRKDTIMEVQGRQGKDMSYAVVKTLLNGKLDEHYVVENAANIIELL